MYVLCVQQIKRIHAASQASSQEAQAARERALNAAKAQLAALREAVDSVLTTGDLPALAGTRNTTLCPSSFAAPHRHTHTDTVANARAQQSSPCIHAQIGTVW